MAWRLRPARPGDAAALPAVNAEAGAEALPRDWLRVPSPRDGDRRLLLVAESGDGRIEAFCLVTLVLNEASLLLIAVSSRVRGQGLGGLLLQALLDALERRRVHRCLLEVRETNRAALALYRRCGFVSDGRRRDYYPAAAGEGREDAILMSWTGKLDSDGT